MKAFLGLCGLISCAAFASPAHALSDCSYRGLPLHGEVAIVPEGADLKVELVSSNADLKIQWTDVYADGCGVWRRVGMGADFTIQIVPTGGDIKIQEVTSGPGLP